MRHPVDYAPSQDFGENPTSIIRPGSPDYWIIEQFGNYQPDGHTGTDYPCPSGTPVRAVSDGIVVHVGWYRGIYADNPFWIQPGFAGWCYVVQHAWGFGIYGHCLDGGSRVKIGQRVTEGQVLGLSGNTGASTGDHLHFEILRFGFVLNSYMYGRSNPATLFSGIQPQSSTATASEEDDMFTDQDRADLKLALERSNRAAGVADAIEGDGIRARVVAIDERTADQSSKLADIAWDESTQTSLRQEVANIKVSVTAILRAVEKLGK